MVSWPRMGRDPSSFPGIGNGSMELNKQTNKNPTLFFLKFCSLRNKHFSCGAIYGAGAVGGIGWYMHDKNKTNPLKIKINGLGSTPL